MVERAYHHGNLREELLDRAERVIETDGIDALSLRQLARGLEVSHAAPARHFRDRQALLDALVQRGFRAMNALLERAAASETADLPRFRAVAHAYASFAVAHPALVGAMYTLKHHPDATELRAVGDLSMQLVRQLIEEAQRTGALAPGDVDTLAHASFASVHGVATLISEGFLPDFRAAPLVDAVVNIVWSGMGGKGDDRQPV